MLTEVNAYEASSYFALIVALGTIIPAMNDIFVRYEKKSIKNLELLIHKDKEKLGLNISKIIWGYSCRKKAILFSSAIRHALTPFVWVSSIVSFYYLVASLFDRSLVIGGAGIALTLLPISLYLIFICVGAYWSYITTSFALKFQNGQEKYKFMGEYIFISVSFFVMCFILTVGH